MLRLYGKDGKTAGGGVGISHKKQSEISSKQKNILSINDLA